MKTSAAFGPRARQLKGSRLPKFSTQRRVPYTAQQMFDVVADVEQYPRFLPMCEALTVKSRSETGDAIVLVASMSVGYHAIRETFSTRATLKPSDLMILVEYLDGPFKRLENRWQFINLDRGSEIDFFIDYEFRSPLLAVVMGALFDHAFRKFAEAFEDRARLIYGAIARA